MTNRALFEFIWQCIKPFKGAFFLIFLLSFIVAFDTILWPYILGLTIDAMTTFDLDRSSAMGALKVPIIGGIALWLVVEVGFRSQGFLMAYAFPELEAAVRMKIFDHVQRHSPRYFNEHFAGSLANKVSDLTSQISTILLHCLTLFLPIISSSLLAIFFLSRIHPFFGWLMGSWMVVHFLLTYYFSTKVDQYEELHSEDRSELSGKIVDSLTNNFVVNLFYRFSSERASIGFFQQKEKASHRQARMYIEKMRICLGILLLFGGGLFTYGFMIYFWLKGEISTGQVAQIFDTNWNIVFFFWSLSFSLPAFFQSIGTAKQALSILKDPQDVLDQPNAKPLKVKEGKIVFDNVSFHYGENHLFKNKKVEIRGGEKVGLVGYSGAGKTTFVNLILRFYPLDGGKILIDGQNIADTTLESLRSKVSLIPQDPILFHRSLKENIAFGKEGATDDEIYAASVAAHCHEFIERLPLKYDSIVGERGTKLSGGERQRIAIARAILAGAPILLLDEATSSLDSRTEKYIQKSLEKLMENRTTLVIAHRLSTLDKMDRLLVFERGKIVEEGKHTDLVVAGGPYSRLWQMQSSGFLPEASI